MSQYPTYFYSCRKCLRTDSGTPLFDFEVVDCPHCGSTDLKRWQAKPNLSREWAHCEAYGHNWVPEPRQPLHEACACCGDQRNFQRVGSQ